MDEAAEPSDAEIDAVIEEFGGDPRGDIGALLHDIAVTRGPRRMDTEWQRH